MSVFALITKIIHMRKGVFFEYGHYSSAVYDKCDHMGFRACSYDSFKCFGTPPSEVIGRFAFGEGQTSAAVYPFLIIGAVGKFSVVFTLEVTEVAFTEVMCDEGDVLRKEYLSRL